MTKDKFQSLCEQVLVPRIADLLHRQMAELHDTLDIVARELVVLDRKLDGIAAKSDDKR